MPAVEQQLVLFIGTMTDAVRNTVEEYGLESLEPGRRARSSTTPTGSARTSTTSCFIRPVFHDGRDRRLRQPAGAPARHGRRRARRLRAARSRTSTRTASCSRRSCCTGPASRCRSTLQPDLRQRPLRRDRCCPTSRRSAPSLRLGERLLARDRRALRRRGRPRRDALRLRRLGRGDARGARERCPTASTRARTSSTPTAIDDTEEYRITVQGHQARRPRRGRLQRHLAPGARRASTPAALDAKTDGRRGVQVPVRPAHAVHVRRRFRHIDIVHPAGDDASARCRPTAPSSCTGRAPGADLPRSSARCAQALGRARRRRRLRLAEHPQRPRRAARRHAVGLGRPKCGGEHGPWGATRDGDADTLPRSSTWPTDLDPATEAIEADVPVVDAAQGDTRPTPRGPGYNRGGAGGASRTRCSCSRSDHYAMPLHATRSRAASASTAARDGRTGGVVGVRARARTASRRRELSARTPTAYGDATPVAGMLDPETQRCQTRAGSTCTSPACRSGTRSRTRLLPLPDQRRRRLGQPARARARARQDRRARRVRDDRRRARDYGVVITGDPEEDPEGLIVDLEATERMRTSLREER